MKKTRLFALNGGKAGGDACQKSREKSGEKSGEKLEQQQGGKAKGGTGGGSCANSGEKSQANNKEMREFYRNMQIDVLARTIWGEARSEGSAGMQAVANVVLNRVAMAARRGKFWWGNNIIQVCQKPYQFSCWNRSDPNFQKLMKVGKSNPYFAAALEIARRAVDAELEDITGGATHYHADYVSPYWVKSNKPSAIIGRHLFYKLVES